MTQGHPTAGARAFSAPAIPAVRDASGWVTVVTAAVVMLATLPGRTQGLGLITEPMLHDLQLDRVAYAQLNLWATLLGALICLPIGRLFDRAGLRAPTIALMLLLAGVVWTMSRLGGGAVALFLLVLATRAIGQSALSVSSITAIGKSFDRRVGLASGVYAVLMTVLFAAGFTAIGTSVRVDGWRTAWSYVAIGLVALAPTVWWMRERVPARLRSDAETVPAEDGLTLAEALRAPAFWVFGGATSLFGLVSSGLGLFNEAVLAERGFDQQTYVSFLTATTVVGLGGQLLCGWLSLRWSMSRILALAMGAYALAMAGVPMMSSRVHLWGIAVLIGLAGGMVTVLFFAVWRRGFGTRHLGRIQGAAQTLTVLASAVGPLIFAQSASRLGSYFPALWMLTPCVLLIAAAAWRVRLPGEEVRG